MASENRCITTSRGHTYKKYTNIQKIEVSEIF